MAPKEKWGIMAYNGGISRILQRKILIYYSSEIAMNQHCTVNTVVPEQRKSIFLAKRYTILTFASRYLRITLNVTDDYFVCAKIFTAP